MQVSAVLIFLCLFYGFISDGGAGCCSHAHARMFMYIWGYNRTLRLVFSQEDNCAHLFLGTPGRCTLDTFDG